jgi:hypothetical protein
MPVFIDASLHDESAFLEQSDEQIAFAVRLMANSRSRRCRSLMEPDLERRHCRRVDLAFEKRYFAEAATILNPHF